MIKATIIADSVSESGARITTFELEYPRIILSEFNTHRQISKNSASSRAIPFNTMLNQLQGKPVRFGEAQAGMQDQGSDFNAYVMGWPQEYEGNGGSPAWNAEEAWDEAREHAIYFSQAFKEAGYAKQVYNRLTEPFQVMKTVATATDWDNFFHLRYHADADPTIHALAKAMYEAYTESTPELLKEGEYHTPYVEHERDGWDGGLEYFIEKVSEEDDQSFGMKYEEYLCVDDAIKVSISCCAQVSYRKLDDTLEKARTIIDRLFGTLPVHASPAEHVATPIVQRTFQIDDEFYFNFDKSNVANDPESWDEGITHVTKDGTLCSGNFKGFVQYRQLIPHHTCYKYNKQ